MVVVGAPPLYVMQQVTGSSRPGEGSAGSHWHFLNDNNGVSGHAFIGAVPFLAASGIRMTLADGRTVVGGQAIMAKVLQMTFHAARVAGNLKKRPESSQQPTDS
jgi:hypothetical protein